MRIVNLKLHESTTQSIYVDFDKVLLMSISEVSLIKNTDHGQAVFPVFRVTASFDNGSNLVVYEDVKKDLCNNWITQNWVKR